MEHQKSTQEEDIHPLIEQSESFFFLFRNLAAKCAFWPLCDRDREVEVEVVQTPNGAEIELREKVGSSKDRTTVFDWVAGALG
ncbi:hypothetical protein JTE90_001677 [Oedothorax gibbosus]|uniref:Uncharacterized protein n=1 Tax=Oedothorax gibbosus TaxID=931172 RepID=A0AAV6UKF4_9ARAC|nr:hypothetical protein JTE90_001677 [Oedothorax gibbosus]